MNKPSNQLNGQNNQTSKQIAKPIKRNQIKKKDNNKEHTTYRLNRQHISEPVHVIHENQMKSVDNPCEGWGWAGSILIKKTLLRNELQSVTV